MQSNSSPNLMSSPSQYNNRSPKNFSDMKIPTVNELRQDDMNLLAGLGREVNLHSQLPDIAMQQSPQHLLRQSQNNNSTYNEVQAMLKGIFSNLNLGGQERKDDVIKESLVMKNPSATISNQKAVRDISPTKPIPLDYMLIERLREEEAFERSVALQGRRKSESRYQDQPIEETLVTEEKQDNSDNSIFYQKGSIIKTLKDQNHVLRDQLQELNTQLELLAKSTREYDRQRHLDLTNNQCNHEVQIQQLENMTKIRDQEYRNLLHLQQSTNSAKGKEFQAINAKLKNVRLKIEQAKAKNVNTNITTEVGFEKIKDLEAKLKDSERKQAELQNEVNSLQKIQNEQSKALQQIGNQKNYPSKIRELISELRDVRDKNKLLEERCRYYEESKKKIYSEMLTLEDKCREIKTKIGAYQGNIEDNQKLQTTQQESGIDDGKMNLIRKVQILEKQILEKDRQNRVMHQKLREIQQQ